MELVALLGGAVGASIFAFKRKNILLTLAAIIMWLILLSWTRSNPIAGMATGSTADEFFVFLCFVMAVGVGLQYFITYRREKDLYKQGFITSDSGNLVNKGDVPTEPKRLMSMSNDEYQQLFRKGLRRRRR